MKLINADMVVHWEAYDDEHESFTRHSGTIAEFLDQMTDEGCPEPVDAVPVEAMKIMLDEVPSAQPGWIPCIERLPEEHEWIGTKKFGTTISNEVYVTFENPDGERFAKHISFQNGKLSPADEQRMKVWYKGAKPIAWMPLPGPWEGGKP